jgi:nucleoside-diphosphate-sugar epimerase
MKILVTGAAGLIGMRVAQRLLARGDEAAGVESPDEMMAHSCVVRTPELAVSYFATARKTGGAAAAT